MVVISLLSFVVGCRASVGNLEGGGATGGAAPGGTGSGGSNGSACAAIANPAGGIGADGLPFCKVTTRPLDPMNVYGKAAADTDAALDAALDAAADAAARAAADGAARAATDATVGDASRISTVANTSNDGDNCNRLYQTFQETADGGDAGVEDCFTDTAPACAPQTFASDGGEVALEGGASEAPAGGALVDGDYQLVRYRSEVASGHSTKRVIGVYAGATYVEWASYEEGGSAFGEDEVLRLNTTMSAAGTTWAVVTVNCGSLGTTSYGYTANGTELDLYDTDAQGVLQNVYTYQRTCNR
jgi:hypothetical protein